MNRTRYLLVLLTLLLSVVARGQDFNPDSPAEPNARYRVSVKASPAEAATVTGTGYYPVNTRVTVAATANDTRWRFMGWTDDDSTSVSTSSSFTYTTTNRIVTLTAHYEECSVSHLKVVYNPTSVASTANYTYRVGSTLYLTAPTVSNLTFLGWTNSEGDTVSTTRTYTYTFTDKDETLTANYRFTPGSPSEPSETKPKHRVYFTADPSGAGYFSQTSGMQVQEGSTFSILATAYSNYTFSHWTRNGETAGTSRWYSDTMGTEDITLVAHYDFTPSSPSEPSTDTKARYTLYATTTETYKGQTTLLPVYMENTGNVKDISFTLALPPHVQADVTGIQTTLRSSAYTVSASQTDTTLTVSLTGGTQFSEKNGVLLRIPLTTDNDLSDGTYALKFGNITATLTDGTAPTFTSRNGLLSVTTLDESDLQALFSVDRYMNRAQFTNMSTTSAQSFEWDFGDGTTSTERNPMHIYATDGTYTVTLTARGVVKSVTAEQTIVINPSSTWTANGDYTLNASAIGPRNFTSLHEALDLLGQCKPDGNITVSVRDKNLYAATLTDADSLALLKTLGDKLTAANVKMTFVCEQETAATLLFTANAVDSELQQVTAFIATLGTQNVQIAVNGAIINIAEIGKYTSQTICSGATTQPEALTAISSDSQVTVAWTASIASGCTVTGYEAIGTGNLPAMTLDNNGSATDKVTYHIDVRLGSAVLYTYNYIIYVRPLITNQTFTLSSPATGSTLTAGQQTLGWKGLGSLATGYTLLVTRTDADASEEEAAGVKYNTTATSQTITVAEGASYEWKVTAYGECGESIESETRTFSVKYLPDLTIMSVTIPEEVKAKTAFTVTAVIRNTGKGDTGSYWTDALWYSATADGSLSQVVSTSHSGVLAPGEEYTTTFTVVSPEASADGAHFLVSTDVNNNVSESDEYNNRSARYPVAIISRYMSVADYEALKVLYNATNGGAWTTTWKINNNAITASAYPGVTFDDDGNVTAINVTGFGLNGTLPTEGFTLPYLTSLNLSSNALTGDLPAFCRQLTALTSLNMSRCLFTELAEPLPATITSLNLGYQCSTRSLETITLQTWDIGDVTSEIVLGSVIGYDHAAQDFNAHPTLQLLTASGNNYAGKMVYDGEAYRYTLSGDYTYAQGTEFVVQPIEGAAAYTRLRAQLNWTKGDVNADGLVDVLDAQQTLNYIVGTHSGNFNWLAADTYESSSINVQDVVATVNLFITDEETTGTQTLAKAYADGDRLSDCTVSTTGDGLWLDANSAVAALDLTLSGVKATDVRLLLSSKRYQMITHNTASGVRIVIISPTGDAITGRQCLLRLGKAAQIVRATAADPQAQALPLAIGDTATGIEDIRLPQGDDTIYDLSGRRLTRIGCKGVYVVNGKKVVRK